MYIFLPDEHIIATTDVSLENSVISPIIHYVHSYTLYDIIKKLQSQYGVIIDETDLFESFRVNLDNRRTQIALEEMKLYESIYFQETVFESESLCGSPEKFETIEIVKFETRLLRNDDRFPSVSSIREEF